MNYATIQRILGLLLMVFSLTMLPPALVGLLYGEADARLFLVAFSVLAVTGLVAWVPVRKHHKDLRLRDGFMIVVLFWVVLGLSGALPFALSEYPQMSITDSVFESVSGLTTTGATVITHIDDLSHALLFYRQQLQWLGGMGIIVLAVAILPVLGIGGMQLYRAETPGPVKDTKLTPRITETAKALWMIYLSLTVLCAVAYWVAGMEPFDAIGHAFSTVAIGGFSTHDASIGYYQSTVIEMIAVVFMFISGINFALHYVAWRGRRPSPYLSDPEVRAYILVILTVAVSCTIFLTLEQTYDDIWDAMAAALFQAVSIGTTTGFTTAEYAAWPSFLPVMLLFASFVGGCAGSTGGGLKVIRFLLLIKQGYREIQRLIHPNAVLPVKVGGKVMNERVISAVWGFFALYVGTFAIMMLGMMSTGLDQVTAFSAVAATINNLGPGLGEVATDFAQLSDPAKWIGCFAMLLGRLEIFTLLVLFTPDYWRK
ncbi:MAG: TrkH family potassium uptake protein [Gammaproteobacteria bacterium]